MAPGDTYIHCPSSFKQDSCQHLRKIQIQISHWSLLQLSVKIHEKIWHQRKSPVDQEVQGIKVQLTEV